MATRTVHVCLDLRGALLNWPLRRFRNLVRDASGAYLEPREAKAALLEELARGVKVLPIGEPCEGFDYSGGGCPGHERDIDV